MSVLVSGRPFGDPRRYPTSAWRQYKALDFGFNHKQPKLEIWASVNIDIVALHSKYKDLCGKKTYRFCNLRKWKDFNKKQLTSLKMCVTSLLCGPRADLWPFYGFLCKRFSLYIKVYQGWALQRSGSTDPPKENGHICCNRLHKNP